MLVRDFKLAYTDILTLHAADDGFLSGYPGALPSPSPQQTIKIVLYTLSK